MEFIQLSSESMSVQEHQKIPKDERIHTEIVPTCKNQNPGRLIPKTPGP